MPKHTTNPIDAERNAKERRRNQSLQITIAAIGKEVGMEHLRKQDYLDEALRQLKAYHEMKAKEQTEVQYLQLILEAVRRQFSQAQAEIARLRGMLNLAPQTSMMQVDFPAATYHQVVPGNDSSVSSPSNCCDDGEDLILEAQTQPEMLQMPAEHQNTNEPQRDVDMEPHEVLVSLNSANVSPSASNGSQLAEELSQCNGGAVFEDFLSPAEEEMLKDFQEPDIDLLFGNTIDFLDLEEEAVPTSGHQLEERSDFPPSSTHPNYDINALLADPQYF